MPVWKRASSAMEGKLRAIYVIWIRLRNYLVPKLQLGNAYPQAQLDEHLFQNKSDIWDVGLVEKRDLINRDRCGSCITASCHTTVKRGYVDLLEHISFPSSSLGMPTLKLSLTNICFRTN